MSWSESFDNILNHPRFFVYCNNEIDITTIYEITDIVLKIEVNMNKSVGDSKAITYAKWNKRIEELIAIKDATWLDIKNDIAIWEVIAYIKDFPSEDNDQTREESAYNMQEQFEEMF